MNNLFEVYINKLSKEGDQITGYSKMIHYWCYRQLLGLFPLEGEPGESPYNLLDYWTVIKRKNILFGNCVTLELGDDIVVAQVDKIKRNLSEKILHLEIRLDDEQGTKIILLTEIGKEALKRKIDIKKKEIEDGKANLLKSLLGVSKGKEEEIKELQRQLIDGDKKFIFWQNNSEEMADMKFINPVLEDLDKIHENMNWDRKRSRKQVVVSAARKPGADAWTATKNSLEEDYICLVYPEDELPSPIMQHKLENPESRQRDLWEDHDKVFDFLKRMIGIPHLTHKKKERQITPEVALMESQFIAFWQEKRELLEKSIREWMHIFAGNYKLVPIEAVEGEWIEEESPLIEEKDTEQAKI